MARPAASRYPVRKQTLLARKPDMSKALACFCAAVLGATLAAPASAQIIIGGEPVTAPGQPAPVQLTFPVDADAAGYVDISIAAPAFSGASPAEAEIAAKIAEVVRADLASVGIFAAPEGAAISTFAADIGALPAWADWSGAGVGALLLGKAVIGTDNSISVQFRLYDVAARKQLIGTQYQLGSVDLWRRAAHKVSDDVMVALVGGKGGFDSRIAVVSEAGGKMQLWAIDQDGVGGAPLVANISGLQAPRYSPNGLSVVYSGDAPVPGKPSQAQRTTIIYDLAWGRREPLTTGVQPNGDARYAPDGKSLVFSRKDGVNTDIFLKPLSGGAEARLTDDKAADSEPSLSPDGTMFAFVSDRAGGEAIYVARVDGAAFACADGSEAKACRITKEAGQYDGPVWSPSGDWIAYSQRTGKEAAIHIVRPDGAISRALTTSDSNVLDLHPAWSPDGRRIAFSRLTATGSALYTLVVATGDLRKMDAPGAAYEPDWGPKLP
jgi:TolB protein